MQSVGETRWGIDEYKRPNQETRNENKEPDQHLSFFALIASPLLDDFLLRFRGRQC